MTDKVKQVDANAALFLKDVFGNDFVPCQKLTKIVFELLNCRHSEVLKESVMLKFGLCDLKKNSWKAVTEILNEKFNENKVASYYRTKYQNFCKFIRQSAYKRENSQFELNAKELMNFIIEE